MARRILALTSAVAWASLAQAQVPAFIPGSPPAANPAGGIITLRTAGQPERRVQILKTEKLPDGKVLTEVRDIATGVVFTIADTKPLAPNLPMATPAPQTQPATHTTTHLGSNLPQARSRTSDPLLGGTVMPQTQTQPQPQEYPSLLGKLRQQRQDAQPAVPGKQSAISKALLGSHDTPRQPLPTLAGRLTENSSSPSTPRPTYNSRAAVFGGGSQSVETPTLASKLFGDKPIVTKPVTPSRFQPQPQQQVHSNIIRPAAVATTPPPRIAVKPEPVMTTPPQQVLQQVESLEPIRTDPTEPNFQVVPVKAMTMKQIEEIVRELRSNARPTHRLEAADALAASPMAGMIEVRQIIAEASYRDPVPVVRAHCIEILAKMQYDEPNYRSYVESLINDEEPAVQRAARAAMR